MGNRENWVDYAKAIGIILVVYGHVARGLYNAGIDCPDAFYKLSDSIVYSFHMPLFFFLSGLFFLSSFSKKGGVKLIFSKIDTVFYPYVIWSIFQGSIEVLLSSFTTSSVSFNEVFSLLWSPRSQFWFLYALFSIFVLSSVVYSLISKRFTILVFIFSVALYLWPSLLPQDFIFSRIASNFVFFIAGVVFTMYFKAEYFSSFGALIGLAVVFIAGQWFFHGYLSHQFTDKSIGSFLLACVSIVFVVSVSSCLSRANYSLFSYIGSTSMAIYLMHILTGSGSRVILSAFGIDSFLIHLVVGCVMGILAPLIAVFIINKLKIQYVLSAPISYWGINSYNKLLQRTR